MKSIIIATAVMLCFFSVKAQSGPIPVAKIQKLLDKAVGQKYVNLMGNKEQITRQEITETTYTLFYIGLGKYGSKWEIESTNIQWDKGFNYFTMSGRGNDKLTQLIFEFKNEMNWNMHVEGKTGDDRPPTNRLEFYILTKDYDEFNSLIKNK